ncbi:YgdI/YgdR family lipoprotein [Azotobacter salinestris]|uniref:YgdI/YgdR family lipoprotein n=1 Tax=Azotobacter salinestris TaxID=69964 RepID=UPI001266C88C|nr:YgdI/YgdR family lipoprotein [Azotobacter salinestris]
MKTRNVPSVVLLLSAMLLAGCSGPAIVTLKDGRQLKTTDTPEYDEETGFYEFERYGRRMRVSEDAILNIRDAD